MTRFLLKTYWSICFILLTIGSFAQLREGFNNQLILDNLATPVGITFDENGQLYTWEKAGIVQIIDTNNTKLTTPLLDISDEVGDWADHGLLGLALDPSFMNNGYFYILYAVDKYHLLNEGSSTYSSDSSFTNVPSIGRITRYQADPSTNYTSLVAGSRKVLLGETISTGIPLIHLSHGVGALAFGTDGTLLVSVGDGASFLGLDIGGNDRGAFATEALADGIITDDQDIGSYRAQYLGSLNGKILRLDPNTGDGVSSNPFFDSNNPRSAQSRVWASGFRNPFRFTVRPSTGSHYPADGNPGVLVVGDVGGSSYEELNVVTKGGQNFGWPIYEGMLGEWYFWNAPAPENKLAPNPLFGQGGCDQEYFNFRDLLQRETAKPNWVLKNPCDTSYAILSSIHVNKETTPIITWSNRRGIDQTVTHVRYFQPNGYFEPIQMNDPRSQIVGDTFSGYCTVGGLFYDGDNFPDEYKGKFFNADLSNWIRIFEIDDSSNLISVDTFSSSTSNILNLALHPKNGKLYYVNLIGEIHAISFGGNIPPIAILEADTTYGGNSLTVKFDASKSYDPTGLPITYAWDFDDGTTSTNVIVEHTFSTSENEPTSYLVTLTVTDSLGLATEEEVIISLNNTPPDFEFSTFQHGDLYPTDRTTILGLAADVVDAEHSEEELTYHWQTYLHHNDHYHPEPPSAEPVSHAIISPIGCGDEAYFYRIELTVTDPEGLSTTKSAFIYPNCDGTFVLWDNVNASAHSNGITVTWSTLQEQDVTTFAIQRSTNNRDFKTIGTVAATGINSSYSFDDNQPVLGTNHYRIKAFTSNRSYDFSPVVRDNFPSSGLIDVYPNPADNFLNIEFNEPTEQAVFYLYTTDGKLIETQVWENLNDNEVKRILTSYLNNGIYIVQIKMGETIWSKKILVK